MYIFAAQSIFFRNDLETMFGLELWHIWFIAAFVFIIIEIFTTGFAVMCFSFGAIAAAIVGLCGIGVWWQVLAFAAVSALAFVFVRPLVLKTFYKDTKLKTNADAIIGREARVTERIDSKSGTGRVAIDGDDWKAVSADEETVEKGERVQVLSRDSIILTVKRI